MCQHYKFSKPRLNFGPPTTVNVDYAKYLKEILVLVKFVPLPNGIPTNAPSF